MVLAGYPAFDPLVYDVVVVVVVVVRSRGRKRLRGHSNSGVAVPLNEY